MDKISVIVPCYNEEESISLFYKEINKVTKKMKDVSFELILILLKNFQRVIKILDIFLFQEILVKKQLFMQDFFIVWGTM